MSEIEYNSQTENIIAPQEFCLMLLIKGFKVNPLNASADNIENIQVVPDEILEVAKFLKNSNDTQFCLLSTLSGVDYPDKFEMVYHLYSVKNKKKLVLKTRINKENPEIESLSSVFSTADWHERETFDLLGIRFKNHPNLCRILLPDDWKGYPLRKDYKQDDERLVWNER